MKIVCPFCNVDEPLDVPATVLAPQIDRHGTTRWVAACDSHWATWWVGSDHEFTPDERPLAFYLDGMKPIPVGDHPLGLDWLDDKEKFCERNRVVLQPGS